MANEFIAFGRASMRRFDESDGRGDHAAILGEALISAEAVTTGLPPSDPVTHGIAYPARGGETIVNDTTAGSQQQSRVAYLSDGKFVVVFWSSGTTGLDTDGVRARLFNADGTPAGSEFIVNNALAGTQSQPDVAALAGGGFAIVWTDFNSTQGDIRARVFNNAGVAQGVGDIVVNDPALSHNLNATQLQPAVAGLTGGRFAVTWTDNGASDGSGSAIRGRVFEATGTAATAEFAINSTTTANSQQLSAITTRSTGFIVAWQDGSGAAGQGVDIRVRTFDLNGFPNNSEKVITTTASTQERPAIVEMTDGRLAAAWTDFSATGGDTSLSSIKGIILGPDGTPGVLGPEFLINEATVIAQYDVALARLPGGGFVATWTDESTTGTDPAGAAVRVRTFSAVGVATSAERQVNTSLSNSQQEAAVTSSANGYVITFTDPSGGIGTPDIRFQRFESAVVNDAPAGTSATLTINEDTPRTLAVADFGFSDTNGNAFAGVVLTTLPASGTLSLNGTAITVGGTFVTEAQVTANQLVYTPAANASGAGAGSFTFQVRDDGGTVDGGQDTDQSANTLTFNVTAQNDAPTVTIGGNAVGTPGAEFLVNQQTVSDQIRAVVLALADGRTVYAWEDPSGTLGDTSFSSIKARIFSAAGVAGNEFLVNSQTFSSQRFPALVELSGGGFVVTWQDSSGTLGDSQPTSIKARVYDTNGNAVGTEFLVNNQVTNSQFEPQVTAIAGNRFVVTWYDDSRTLGDTDGTSIKARIFEGNGTPVSTEFLVNMQTAGSQFWPSITTLSNGNILIVWHDNSLSLGDASGNSAMGRIFTAAGVPVTGQFLVNTQTTSDQREPEVAALASGGFVVTWEDNSLVGGDTSSFGIKAQMFDAAGAKVGGEFLVNTQTLNDQRNPTVAGLEGGGFVITWRDPSGTLGDASGTSIKARAFDANGGALGNEFLVNQQTNTGQQFPVVTARPGGGFTITWQDLSNTLGDLSGSSIKARTYGPPQLAATEQVAGNLKGTVTIADVDVGAGTLVATLAVGYGVLNVTAGTSGATIASGNGTDSVVVSGTLAQLNALLRTDATSTLTYTADTDAPPASTTLSISVSDNGNTGAGAVAMTGSDSETINITAVNDAPAGTDATLTIGEDTPRTLVAADFGYSDIDGNTFAGVVLTTLPASGTLSLNGTAITLAGTFVTAAQVNANQLVYTPAANAAGAGAGSFTFQVRDNGGTANGGVDTDQSANTLTFDVTAQNDAPTTANLQGDIASYTEQMGQRPLDLSTNATIADVDSANFNGGSLRVQITGGLQAGVDSIFYVGNGRVSLSSQSAGATVFVKLASDPSPVAIGTLANDNLFQNDTLINFNSDAATPARVQELFRSIMYNGNDDTLTTGQRTITYTLADGDGGVSTTTSFVDVTGVNDAPVVTAGSGQASFSEGVNTPSTPVAVAPNFSVSDADSTTIASATVTISFNREATDVLAFTNTNSTTFGNVSASYNGANGVLTLISTGATATLAQFQAALRAVTFTSTSEEPSTTSRIISFAVNDGATSSTPSTRPILVQANNDRPSGADQTLTINEDQVRTLSASDFGFSDVDGDAFAGVRFGAAPTGGTLFFDAEGVGVGAAPVAITTFGGGTTYSAVDIAAGRLTFVPTANASGPAAAAISFTVVDDGGTAGAGQNADLSPDTLTFNVTALNDEPSLTDLNAVTFDENIVNATPQLLDAAVTFTDPDGNVAGGKIVVSGLLAEDRVAVRDQGTAAGQIGVSGVNVTFGGTVIGTVAGGVGVNLTVTLNASASVAAVDALIQNLTYANLSNTPTVSRTLAIRITDSEGSDNASFASLSAFGDMGSRAAPGFGDYNGDGRVDLLVGTEDGFVQVFQRQADGSFVMQFGAANPLNGIDFGVLATPALADFTGDGKIDLLVGSSNTPFRAFAGNGSGGFTELTGVANPFAAIVQDGANPTFTDFDGDGDQDLVVGRFNGDFVAYRNTGGVFEPLAGAANPFNGLTVGNLSAPSFVDIDGDGDLDFVSGNFQGTFDLFRNDGVGQPYVPVTGAANPLGGITVPLEGGFGFSWPAFADLNGDGFPDLLAGSVDGTLVAYRYVAGAEQVVTVIAQNDAPSGTNQTLTIDEDQVRTLAASDFGFTDIDGNIFDGVRFDAPPTGGTLFFDADGAGGNAPVAIITFGGGTTYSAADIAAGKLTFVPTANLNGTATAAITFTALDNGGTAGGGQNADLSPNTLTFSIDAVNDPIATNAPASISVNENTPTAVSGLTISDVDATLAPAGVYEATLSATQGSLALTTVTGLTFTTGDGTDDSTMTFHGTVGDINAALATVSFSPSTGYSGSAEITFQATDTFGGIVATGSGAATNDSDTIAVTVIDNNGAPVIDLNGVGPGTGVSATVVEDGGGLVAPDAVVSDTDSANFDGGTLTVSYGADGTASDFVSVQDQSGRFAMNNRIGVGFNFSNGNFEFYYNTVLIGSAPGPTAGNPLVVTFNASATPAAAQALVRAVTTFNISDTPPSGARALTFTLTDGDGGSSSAIADVTTTAVDDKPIGNVPSGTQNATEDANFVFSTANGNAITVSDPDSATVYVAVLVNSGTLTLSQTTGLTMEGGADGSGTIVISGSVTAINAALDGLVYRGDLNFSGSDTLAVQTSANGVNVDDQDQIAIDVAPDGQIDGDSGNNSPTGTPQSDFFDLSQGGNDNASGLAGDDGFYFGAAYTAADVIDGGAGVYDTLGLQGNYSSGVTLGSMVGTEIVALLPGNDARFGDTAGNFYDYVITADAGTIVSNNRLTIQGNTLRAGEDLTFNGSASSIDFLIYGGLGVDNLTGGSGNDGFFFGQGRFGASDVVNGGVGTMDQLGLQGNYTGGNAVSFGAAQLSGLEFVVLLSASDNRFGASGGTAAYDITTHDANVAAGQTLVVSANTLRAGPAQFGETVSFNGSAETDGRFEFFSGDGFDVFQGGSGNDLIFGGGSGDTLYGNGGNDTFAYRSLTDSDRVARDGIQDFTLGDLIDLSLIDANSNVAGNQDFSFVGTNAFSGTAGELRYQNISNGGPVYQIDGDVNGDGVSDLEIVYVLTDGHALTASDFIGVTAPPAGQGTSIMIFDKEADFDFSGLSTHGGSNGGPALLPVSAMFERGLGDSGFGKGMVNGATLAHADAWLGNDWTREFHVEPDTYSHIVAVPDLLI